MQQYDAQLDKYKSDAEELQDKNRSLQAALDNSYKYVRLSVAFVP